MPFQPGNKLAKGGKRAGSGRPRKRDVMVSKQAAQVAREYIEASVKPILATYFQLAHGRLVNKWHEGQIVGQEFEADAPTTRHFIDKLLPDEKHDITPAFNINFIRFDNTVQLSATHVSSPVLEGNGNGHQASVQGVASQERQGQNGLKFHNFKDVS